MNRSVNNWSFSIILSDQETFLGKYTWGLRQKSVVQRDWVSMYWAGSRGRRRPWEMARSVCLCENREGWRRPPWQVTPETPGRIIRGAEETLKEPADQQLKLMLTKITLAKYVEGCVGLKGYTGSQANAKQTNNLTNSHKVKSTNQPASQPNNKQNPVTQAIWHAVVFPVDPWKHCG